MKTQKERRAILIDKEQMHLEVLKIAHELASACDGVGNVLVHAQWMLEFIQTGKPPIVDESKS